MQMTWAAACSEESYLIVPCSDGDQAVILVNLLQSPMFLFLCEKWEGAHLAVRTVSRKHWIKSKMLLYYTWKKEGKEPLHLRELQFRESREIHRNGVNRLFVQPLQSRRADLQDKELADLSWIPGRDIHLCSKMGHLQHLLWQQCPGHNAEKDNKMTAPKNNSIIQKMSCCLGFFLSISEWIYIHSSLAQDALPEFRSNEISVQPSTEERDLNGGPQALRARSLFWAKRPQITQQFPEELVTFFFLLLCTKTRCIFTKIFFSNSAGFNTLFPPAYSHLTPQPYLCQDNCWYSTRWTVLRKITLLLPASHPPKYFLKT